MHSVDTDNCLKRDSESQKKNDFRSNRNSTASLCAKETMSFLNKLFRWEKGRQRSGYDKMLLLGSKWLIRFDVYLLRFNEGSEIKPHIDKIEKGKHYRLNIVLKQAKEGGEFICGNPIYQSNRIKLFRPDACEHSVTKVIRGNRYLLSIGWVNGT